ncbi:MAG: glycosyltransferase family 9 protein [Proteobacteria bacterium]|nr:glycosyltransferase family 9 protein [Pseudomonadota bacterium]
MFYNTDCRLFTGYKPCKYKRNCEGCRHYDRVQTRVCVLSLEALGAVLRSTVLLEPIHRQYPGAHITWITYPSAKALLDNNPFIDRLIVLESKSSHLIDHLHFDVLMSVDKSIEAGAMAERIFAIKKFGFGLDHWGGIRILNPEAQYQFDVGLDDHLKFKVNQKPETQQITESMSLPWKRDEYILHLTETEIEEALGRRQTLLKSGSKGIIGFNTGCSLLFPYKKFTVERAIEVVKAWRVAFPDHVVALLGGKEDAERQAQIQSAFQGDSRVVNTPTGEGLRSGMLWMNTADIVLSGCSLGMHIAIALKKPVIAWFGVSCLQEVDVYNRGVKLQANVTCSPCWRKSCELEPKCYDQVEVVKIVAETKKILQELSR